MSGLNIVTGDEGKIDSIPHTLRRSTSLPAILDFGTIRSTINDFGTPLERRSVQLARQPPSLEHTFHSIHEFITLLHVFSGSTMMSTMNDITELRKDLNTLKKSKEAVGIFSTVDTELMRSTKKYFKDALSQLKNEVLEKKRNLLSEESIHKHAASSLQKQEKFLSALRNVNLCNNNGLFDKIEPENVTLIKRYGEKCNKEFLRGVWRRGPSDNHFKPYQVLNEAGEQLLKLYEDKVSDTPFSERLETEKQRSLNKFTSQFEETQTELQKKLFVVLHENQLIEKHELQTMLVILQYYFPTDETLFANLQELFSVEQLNRNELLSIQQKLYNLNLENRKLKLKVTWIDVGLGMTILTVIAGILFLVYLIVIKLRKKNK